MQLTTKIPFTSLPNLGIYYSLMPFKKDQDVICLKTIGKTTAISVVDGNNNDVLKSYKPGREMAHYVAKKFPGIYLQLNINDIQKKAQKAAEIVEQKSLVKYPKYVSCVGAFLFDFGNVMDLIVVGSLFVFVWQGESWKKPEGIGDYSIEPAKYEFEADVSRFFGSGELKKKRSIYSSEPDAIEIPPKSPIFIASDGIKELLTLNRLNQITEEFSINRPRRLLNALLRHIRDKREYQDDDAAVLIKV